MGRIGIWGIMGAGLWQRVVGDLGGGGGEIGRSGGRSEVRCDGGRCVVPIGKQIEHAGDTGDGDWQQQPKHDEQPEGATPARREFFSKNPLGKQHDEYEHSGLGGVASQGFQQASDQRFHDFFPGGLV